MSYEETTDEENPEDEQFVEEGVEVLVEKEQTRSKQWRIEHVHLGPWQVRHLAKDKSNQSGTF